MSSFQGDELYRTKDEILSSFISAWQTLVPDVWINADGTLYILLEIESGQVEGLYLANQLLLQSLFIQTADGLALQRYGETFGLPQQVGSIAIGELKISGRGGTYVPIGSEAAYDPGAGAPVLYFITTEDDTIPSPGSPSQVTVADQGTSGNLTGTFEYAVTFVTASGEGLIGPDSSPVTLTAHKANVTSIPLGGPGTTARKIYRNKNGTGYLFVAQLSDNTTLTYIDNIADGSLGSVPPTTDASLSVTVAAQSESTGSEYNAVPGAIVEIVSMPDGVTDVSNPSAFTNGGDTEETESYRTRLLNFIRSPQSGAPQDIQNWAEEVEGVASATVFPNDNLGTPAPGHVTVRIAGPNGSIPGSDVQAAVLAALQAIDLASITIHVTVFSADVINVAATLTPATGFTTSELTPQVQAAITDYINSVPVGGTVYISHIVAAVVSVPGVNDVAVTLPATNQTSTSTQKFTVGTITIT